MKMKISVGKEDFLISKSLECQSLSQKDAKNNIKYSGISLYIEDSFSDWLLKSIDPEFKKSSKIPINLPKEIKDLNIN